MSNSRNQPPAPQGPGVFIPALPPAGLASNKRWPSHHRCYKRLPTGIPMGDTGPTLLDRLSRATQKHSSACSVSHRNSTTPSGLGLALSPTTKDVSPESRVRELDEEATVHLDSAVLQVSNLSLTERIGTTLHTDEPPPGETLQDRLSWTATTGGGAVQHTMG